MSMLRGSATPPPIVFFYLERALRQRKDEAMKSSDEGNELFGERFIAWPFLCMSTNAYRALPDPDPVSSARVQSRLV